MKTYPPFGAAVMLAVSCVVLRPAIAAEPAPAVKQMGDLWEVTSQMSMEGMQGMALPAQTSRTCADRDWKKPPLGGNDRDKCETTDFKVDGNKVTWKSRCAGPPAMTGEGEIVRSGADAYTGWMKMTSPDGVMTMKLDGRKVGECDAGAARMQREQMVARAESQVAAAEKMQADLHAQTCKSFVESMSLNMLTMQGTPCTDPTYRSEYCARLGTLDGYKIVASQPDVQGQGLQAATAYCNLNLVESKQKLCREAADKEDFDFLGKNCPKETQELAQRECAGRKPSSLAGTKYYGFCMTYASETLAGAQKDEEQEKKPESKKEKTKKILKGIFP